MLPRVARPGHLRLVGPWQEDSAEWPEHAQADELTADAEPSFDRKAAAASLRDVLREWRAIARNLARIPPGSLDRALLEAEAEVLSAVHRRLFAAINRG